MKDNEKKLEENLLEVAKLKEENDKRLLHLEFVIGVLSVIIFLTFTMMSAYLEIDTYLRVIFLIFGTLVLVVCALYAVRLEQIAGYYECSCCHHKYVPTYKSVNLAMHMGRTRYMKCPKCGKKSWQKKVLK